MTVITVTVFDLYGTTIQTICAQNHHKPLVLMIRTNPYVRNIITKRVVLCGVGGDDDYDCHEIAWP